MDFSQPQILGAVFLIAGVGFVIHTIRLSRKVQEAQMWPSVKGLVTTSVVKRSGGKNRVYRAKIRYTYTVHGHEFTGRRYALGGEVNTSSRGPAEARCVKYPEGSEPEVYYDPANPKDACLERVQEGKAFVIGIGGLFAAIGAAMLLGFLPGG
jgi:hypothetical protein